MAMINLKDWKDRNISVNEFIAELSKKTKGISDARSKFLHHHSSGFGNTSGSELRLLDRSGGDIVNTDKVTKEFIKN